ncbi:MAG TPA: 30S ribosomal protein S1 [Nitrospirae bacterium]|nr:30S ribosomal protein S1 [Nitrospirota bacterium]HDZ01911.1 30S ribosomal protein S1 [Nitrospirota bacterium]
MELQMDDLEKFYADSFKGLRAGAITKGKVLQIKPDGVIVDVGSKSEGFVPLSELGENELDTLNPGDEVEVFIERLSDQNGFVKLSRQKARGVRTWDMIEEAFKKNEPVDGRITGKVKGGMTVNIGGVNAFLPGSQIDLKAPRNTDSLIGQTHTFKVLNLNNKGANVIVSRRVLLEEERNKLREQTLTRLKEGIIMEGVVKNLTDYGAFIDLGGIDGLLHISDMSWGRISHPGELFSIGDTVEVIILTFDTVNEKVTLGYKQKKPDPWASVEEKYPAGRKVLGKVITITDYGIFIELEEGVEGLIHVSEIDWLEKSIKPSKYFSIGDKVEAAILKVSKNDKRISLSIRQLKPNPWEVVKDKYTAGQKIRGKVKSFAEFGAFISMDEGIDALLHISDISWVKRVKHPSDILKKGEEIEVVVLNVEPEKERISVGLKQLTTDPWINEIPARYNLGDTVKGKVASTADFGLFIELEDGVEGLIHVSEIEKKPDEKIEELFKPGTEVTARIINVIPADRKIDLSMKTMIG